MQQARSSLPIHVYRHALSYAFLQNVECAPVPAAWSEALIQAPEFALALDPEQLWLLAKAPTAPRSAPQALPNTFCADLWKFDVAELFLREPGSKIYYEFNLAPNSAWWACRFCDYRRPDHSFAPLAINAVTYSTQSANSWQAALALPLNNLNLTQNILDYRANVTFCLGNAPQSYFSWAEINSPKPDFHLSDQFVPLAQQRL